MEYGINITADSIYVIGDSILLGPLGAEEGDGGVELVLNLYVNNIPIASFSPGKKAFNVAESVKLDGAIYTYFFDDADSMFQSYTFEDFAFSGEGEISLVVDNEELTMISVTGVGRGQVDGGGALFDTDRHVLTFTVSHTDGKVELVDGGLLKYPPVSMVNIPSAYVASSEKSDKEIEDENGPLISERNRCFQLWRQAIANNGGNEEAKENEDDDENSAHFNPNIKDMT